MSGRVFVASAPMRDLLFRAKHLSAAAIVEHDRDRPAAHVDGADHRLRRGGRLAVPVLMVNRQGRDSPPHT